MNFLRYLFALPHGDSSVKVLIYKLSTLSLAHWVFRKNLSEDLMEGSLLKQLILM